MRRRGAAHAAHAPSGAQQLTRALCRRRTWPSSGWAGRGLRSRAAPRRCRWMEGGERRAQGRAAAGRTARGGSGGSCGGAGAWVAAITLLHAQFQHQEVALALGGRLAEEESSDQEQEPLPSRPAGHVWYQGSRGSQFAAGCLCGCGRPPRGTSVFVWSCLQDAPSIPKATHCGVDSTGASDGFGTAEL